MTQSYYVGILSRLAENAVKICASIRAAGETVPIVIADDGLPENVGLDRFSPLTRIPCTRPFNFARNSNAVIGRFPDQDVFLINDDAVLLGNGKPIHFLRETALEPGSGVVSAAIDGKVGNRFQSMLPGLPVKRPLGKLTACFVAVYLSRTVIERVGILDERFDGYGFEDSDYSVRCRRVGLRNLVDARCVVKHDWTSSTFRKVMKGDQVAQFRRASRIFKQKWPDECR